MNFMSAKRLASVAVLAFLATFSLTACGGSDRPSVEEVSAAMQKGDSSLTDEAVADCMAKVFVNSDISDETLQKAVEDDKLNESDIPEKDKKVVESKEFSADLMECAKESKEFKDMEKQMEDLEGAMPESDSSSLEDMPELDSSDLGGATEPSN